jgi:hypothetical protein
MQPPDDSPPHHHYLRQKMWKFLGKKDKRTVDEEYRRCAAM